MNSKLALLCAVSLAAWAAQAQQPPAAARPPPGMPPGMQGGPPPGPRRPDHVARGPSLAASLKMAEVIAKSCHGYHIGVSVIDAEGTPKLFYIPDGTAGFHAYTGYRKANTALKFAMPSGKVAEATKADPQLAKKFEADAANFVTFAGGMPIMAGNEVIGAVGVSGAEPSAKDEACAVDGLNAVKTLLK